MTTVTGLCRHRQVVGVSLTELARRSGIARSNLSAIEHARRDPTASTVDRIARNLDSRILVVPDDGRASAANIAEEIVRFERDGDWRGSYRAFLQLANSLTAASSWERILLAAEPPLPVDPEWDAAIAGLVEWKLDEAGIPAPPWADSRPGDPRWRWHPKANSAGIVARARENRIPASLRDRGIWIEERELQSA